MRIYINQKDFVATQIITWDFRHQMGHFVQSLVESVLVFEVIKFVDRA